MIDFNEQAAEKGKEGNEKKQRNERREEKAGSVCGSKIFISTVYIQRAAERKQREGDGGRKRRDGKIRKEWRMQASAERRTDEEGGGKEQRKGGRKQEKREKEGGNDDEKRE